MNMFFPQLWFFSLLVFSCFPAEAIHQPKVDLYGDQLPEWAIVRLGTIRPGNGSTINGIAFSPKGQTYASAGQDRTVRIWDAVSGRQIRLITGHKGHIETVAYSPDGKWIVSASSSNFDNSIRIWDAHTGRQKFTFKGSDKGVKAVAFSPDGKHLAANKFNDIHIWSLATGAEVLKLQGHQYMITSIAYFPNGRKLASTGYESPVRIWDLSTGKQIRTFSGNSRWASEVVISTDGNFLAADFERVYFWDLRSGKIVHKFPSKDVECLALSSDGQFLAAGGFERAVDIWNLKSGRRDRILKQAGGVIDGLAFSPNGKHLLASTRDPSKTIHLWDIATGKELHRTPQGHSSHVYDLSFSSDGKKIATAGGDAIRLWDATTGHHLRKFKGRGAFNCVSYSPDGDSLASGDNYSRVFIWSLSEDLKPNCPVGHAPGVWEVAFSPDGKRIASTGRDKTVSIWSVTSERNQFGRLQTPLESRALAWSPDGKSLATGGYDKAVHIWDMSTGVRSKTLKGHSMGITSVAFSGDGGTLASASYDNTIRLWTILTGKNEIVIHGPKHDSRNRRSVRTRMRMSSIYSVRFSPDGRLLAGACADNSIRLWDALTGKERHKLVGHRGTVFSIEFSPDGRRLASASFDSTILIWDIESLRKNSKTAKASK